MSILFAAQVNLNRIPPSVVFFSRAGHTTEKDERLFRNIRRSRGALARVDRRRLAALGEPMVLSAININ